MGERRTHAKHNGLRVSHVRARLIGADA